MKKSLILLFIICLTISCNSKKSNNTQETNVDNSKVEQTEQSKQAEESEQKFNYTYKKEYFQKGKIRAYYPKFDNNVLNYQIKTEFARNLELTTSADVDYKVNEENDRDIISFVFEGKYVSEDNTLDAVKVLHINKKTNAILHIMDIVQNDEALEKLILSKVKGEHEIYEGFTYYTNFIVMKDGILFKVVTDDTTNKYQEVKVENKDLKFVESKNGYYPSKDKNRIVRKINNLELYYNKTYVKEIDDEIEEYIKSFDNQPEKELLMLRVDSEESSDSRYKYYSISFGEDFIEDQYGVEDHRYFKRKYTIDLAKKKRYRISENFQITKETLDYFYMRYLDANMNFKELTYKEFFDIFDISFVKFEGDNITEIYNEKLFPNYTFDNEMNKILKKGEGVKLSDKELNSYPTFMELEKQKVSKNKKHLVYMPRENRKNNAKFKYPYLEIKTIDDEIEERCEICFEGGDDAVVNLDYIVTENQRNLSTIYLFGQCGDYYSCWFSLDKSYTFDLDNNNKVLKLNEIVKVDDKLIDNIYLLLNQKFSKEEITKLLNHRKTTFTVYNYGIRLQFPDKSKEYKEFHQAFAVPNLYLEYIR